MLADRTIHVGDCRDLLRQLPDDSVNCVVTSPPYWGLRDYGTGTWDGGNPSCPHTFKPGGTARSTLERYDNALTRATIETQMAERGHATYRDVCGKCGARRVDRQIGLEVTPEEYVGRMVEVFREVRRVLRPDGTLWLNLGDSYASGAGIDTRLRDDKRGYRGERLANGRGDHPAVLRVKTRATRDGAHAGKHTAMAAAGPMVQANRLPVPGLKPKDLVGIPWRVAFALQADGWWLRSDVIWAKPNPMPESVTDRPTKAHEYLFLLTKSERYFYDATAIRERQVAPEASTPDDAARAFSRRRASAPSVRQDPMTEPAAPSDGMRNKRSVWTIATEPYGGAHFATFPRALAQPCILAGSPAGGLVLDPFGGSGTVGKVAEDLGRRWMLFELNPDYAELARDRTAQLGVLVPRAAGGEAP